MVFESEKVMVQMMGLMTAPMMAILREILLARSLAYYLESLLVERLLLVFLLAYYSEAMSARLKDEQRVQQMDCYLELRLAHPKDSK